MTPASPLAGRSLGHYRIIEQIGAGGMGIVYRATDQRLGRDVAIKVLPWGPMADDAARKRFHTEALALAKLNHPNIATVYDVGEQEGTSYIVMEFVPGVSLAERLRSGPLSIKEAVALSTEISAALEEAHEQGVIHRDLKPGNIVITPKGRAKVLDFGLAKLFAHKQDDATQSVGEPETRFPVGTPRYMSPEQAQGKKVDSRTDLWSLGVVVYESLAGKSPFPEESDLEVLRSITRRNPRPLREIREDTPREIEQIVSRAMEKDAVKRYQSAAEMNRDLSAVLTHISGPIFPEENASRKLNKAVLAAIATIVLVAAVCGWLYYRSEKRRWAKEVAVPKVLSLIHDQRALSAYLLLQKAQHYLPNDPQLKQIADENTMPVSIESSPPGAGIEIEDYISSGNNWYRLGTTPLKDVRIPQGYFRWRITKPGLKDYIAAPITAAKMNFPLDSEQGAPAGMVWVAGGQWEDMIGFIGWMGPYQLPSYYMDKVEVTNRDFQNFVDQGGYKNPAYWKEKFIRDGRELNWEEAMALLRDQSGREGPSTWSGGHYPEGQANYPVSGVSWFEASAYAAFAGKSLPALTQWYEAAPPEVSGYIVQKSNFSGAPAPAGRYQGLGPFGTYDMLGNAREWVINTEGENRFILGGAWNSPTYLSYDPEALPAFDRSATNGFRCVRNISPAPPEITAPIKTLTRDFSAKPVPDDVYRAYLELYRYVKTPLHAKDEGVVQDTADWRMERITFDTDYDRTRMAGYLFLPKNVKPPYQTVIFSPSARVSFLHDSRHLGDLPFFDYIIQSGRAVFYPIIQGTYERQDHMVLPGMSGEVDQIAMRFKDFARSLDYLNSRNDIDKSKMAYLGVSMGAAEGVIYTAMLQDHFKTAIFLDGGYFLNKVPPEIDQANFAPRLKLPVLMVNGRYDFTFSLERSQDPLFHTLGTPDADKEHVVLETPHDVSQRHDELSHAVLGWLDKYLGRVE